jgi:CBS domain-containing protein
LYEKSLRPGRQHVVTLNHDTSVAKALATLAHHGILSAPVVIQPDLLDAGE